VVGNDWNDKNSIVLKPKNVKITIDNNQEKCQ
jgi:hypothetical protein